MNHQIISTIGLISDTHYQDRLFDMPPGLRDLWADVDIILHAGDVGDLGVLDLLGRIAPTIAVHGNDEPDHVKQELPDQQVVTVNGLRILLWHSHYADPIEEKTNRKGAWGPKLERIAKRGREVNARIVVFGHTHIPMVTRIDGVLLINPGALAAGSYFTRQVISSVGKLRIPASGDIEATHFDVVTGRETVFDIPDPDDDFDLLAKKYQEWLVEPDLIPVVGAFRKITLEDDRAVVQSIIPLYKYCLSNGPMCREDLIRIIESDNLITAKDKQNILAAIHQYY